MAPVTVLLVDDSRVSRMMVRSIIARHHPDWVVHEAGSGEEAQTVAEGRSINFMLVDVNMPGVDGLTAAEQLKTKHPESRISLLTANIQEVLQERARAAGLGFISKPVSEEKIEAFLRVGEPGCSA